ncbi:MAG: hypothetical protein PHH26_08705 [Candidatus Thermoplasmatota archaeon]|nr:hypothetical protein [Candidatus Thermoplasmatota archaeon]
MSKCKSTALICGIFALGGILGIAISELFLLGHGQNRETEIYILIKSALTTSNILLSLILIFTYFRLYRQVGSGFTLAILVAMFAMLAYSVTSHPMIHAICGYCVAGLGPFIIIPDVFATLALGVLLYVGLE